MVASGDEVTPAVGEAGRAVARPTLDGYEVLAEAGAGGMGRVFRARHRQSGALVAIKVLASDEASERKTERFRREAALVAELGREHAGIVGYVDEGLTREGTPFLAMEWVDGITLAERLAAEPLDFADTGRIGAQVARALAAAHARGVLHRDVKPSNIMLAGRDPGRVKLVDFGVARRVDQTQSLTRTGVAMGTPGYMAPEQARGSEHVDARADLFALGCVLYECLAGQPAFAGTNSAAIHCKILLADPPPLASLAPEVPAALAALVGALLAKHPADRPAGAVRVAEVLEELALPAGVFPPRGSEARLPATVPIEGPAALAGARLACAILAGAIVPGAVLDAAAARRIAERVGAPIERLDDGTLATVLAGDAAPEALTARAAALALAVHAEAPHLAVALGAGNGVAAAIDATSRLLTAAAVRAALAGSAPQGVELAPALVPLLAPRFAVRQVAGRGHLLVGAAR